MMSALEINGKSLSSIKEAAGVSNYSRDYITRLAREGKIVASYVGRQWFIDVASLKNYAESTALEQEVRKKQLSEERKRERVLREVAFSQHTLQIRKAKTLHGRSVVTAALVLGFGLIGGFGMYQVVPSQNNFSFFDAKAVQSAQVAKTTLPSPQTELQPTQVNDTTIHATANEVPPQLSAASAEQHSLGDIEKGILLLPENGALNDGTELFSDEVMVQRLADGSMMVVQIDAEGNQIGNEVPFVVVPVTDGNE